MHLWFQHMPSPIGQLKLVADKEALVALLWQDDAPLRVRLAEAKPCDTHPVLLETQAQVTAYFAGDRRTFDIPLQPVGTAFQRAVWSALTEIPYGETRSYGELAAHIYRPQAQRAVGAANGKNPISIIVPCHRVIGANGHLTGFAGGLGAKAFLLNHETSKTAPAPTRQSQFALDMAYTQNA